MDISRFDADAFGKQIRSRALASLRAYERPTDDAAVVPVDADTAIATFLEELVALDPARDANALIVAVENLAFGSPTITHAILPTLQASVLLKRCGSESQKAEYLPTLLKRSSRDPVSMLLLEDGGRGPTEWCTTADRVGSQWRINGRKVAVNMTGTDLHLVAAKTSADRPVAFLIRGARPGQPDRTEPLTSSLALKASRLGTVDLIDDLVDEADRLSGVDDQPLALAKAIGFSRLLLGAVALGTADASLAYAQDWVVNRTAFGKSLSAFEGVAFDIADTDTRLNASRYLLRQVAYNIEHAESVASIDDMVARTLARAITMCAIATTDGIQLMGVHGIIHEHPQELFYRTASSLSTLDLDPTRSSFRLL
jgi:alkylation response protein AidB-like acyl-CoA dehydrogenase